MENGLGKEMSWDKPLQIKWVFNLPELVSAIKRQIDMVFVNPSGRLKASFSLSNMHIIRNGSSEGVEITNSLPYAAIQNYGGRIPDRVPVKGKYMVWTNAGGETVFAKRARGFDISAKNYIEKAIDDWVGGDKNINVEWDK